MTSIADLITRAAAAWYSTPEAVYGHSRTMHHLRARRLAMFLSREMTDLSYTALGDIFGSHEGTIRNACRTMERALRGHGHAPEAAVCRRVQQSLSPPS